MFLTHPVLYTWVCCTGVHCAASGLEWVMELGLRWKIPFHLVYFPSSCHLTVTAWLKQIPCLSSRLCSVHHCSSRASCIQGIFAVWQWPDSDFSGSLGILNSCWPKSKRINLEEILTSTFQNSHLLLYTHKSMKHMSEWLVIASSLKFSNLFMNNFGFPTKLSLAAGRILPTTMAPPKRIVQG